MANSPQEVLVACRQHDVKVVALHVTDALGKWHQLSIPVTRLTEEAFEDGFAWSLPKLAQMRGEIMDVVLIPQPTTAFIQPRPECPTLSLLCTMHDPLTREELPYDPRTIAMQAEKFARDSGVADEVLFGLAIEFFVFDAMDRGGKPQSPRRQFDASGDGAFAHEGSGQSAGYRVEDDLRSEIMQALSDCGVGVASYRQSDNDRNKTRLELSETQIVTAADQVMITKQVVRQLAARWGKSATFMPLPQAGRHAAGMPTQLAIMQGGHCLLSGAGYAGLSETGLHAIGGILKHAQALTALTNSSTNSYARLGLGLAGCSPEAEMNYLPRVAYSQSDLRAALRVPTHRASKQKCLELQLPDAICNPYLAFTGLLMAVVDGVQNKIVPGPALDPDPYAAGDELSTSYQRVPASLSAALTALEEDGEFLLRGDVMSPELLQAWIAHKRFVEIDALRQQPHPHEIAAYYEM